MDYVVPKFLTDQLRFNDNTINPVSTHPFLKAVLC